MYDIFLRKLALINMSQCESRTCAYEVFDKCARARAQNIRKCAVLTDMHDVGAAKENMSVIELKFKWIH